MCMCLCNPRHLYCSCSRAMAQGHIVVHTCPFSTIPICHLLINPWHACAWGLLQLGCLSVCVCVSVSQHLPSGASVRLENAVTYSTCNEGQDICGDFLKLLCCRDSALPLLFCFRFIIYPTCVLFMITLGTLWLWWQLLVWLWWWWLTIGCGGVLVVKSTNNDWSDPAKSRQKTTN